MSLYLQIGVGAALYLLDISDVRETRLDIGTDDARPWQGEGVETVDLRALFEEPAGPQACAVLITQSDGTAAALIVDRVDGLAEFDAAEFHSLPPIGPIGGMIDGLAMRASDQRLLLRLRGECVLAIAAAVG